MIDAHWAVCQNIVTVNYSTFKVIVTFIGSELLKHFNLVDDCIDQVLILSITCIVWIKLNCPVECLFGLSYFTQGQERFKQSLVDSWERGIKSDPSLAVFDSFSVHLEVDVAHGAIGEDLHTWLDVASLIVQHNCCSVI